MTMPEARATISRIALGKREISLNWQFNHLLEPGLPAKNLDAVGLIQLVD
jgi:hypothetical protein